MCDTLRPSAQVASDRLSRNSGYERQSPSASPQLPLAAAVLPLAGLAAEQEWVHTVLVVAAGAVFAAAFWGRAGEPAVRLLIALGGGAMALLLIGASGWLHEALRPR